MAKVTWVVAVAAVAGLASMPAGAQSQRPVRLLVASAPGGPSDVQARLITPRMSEVLARTLVVDNRASANGLVATEMCSRAEPDGAAVCVGNSGTHAVNATLYLKLAYDPIRDFAPITQFSTTGMVLAANPLLPDVPTVAEQGLPGYDFQFWNGLFAPAKIDRRAVRSLHKSVLEALNTPAVKERFAALGLVIVGNTPEAFAQVVKTDVEKFRKIILESGITRL